MKKAKKLNELISRNIQWQVFVKGEWRVFSPYLNTELEMKFMSCQNNDSKIRLLDENNCFFEADVKENKLSYDFDLGLKHYEMRRVEFKNELLLFDAYWTSTKDYEVVRLDPNSVIYNATLGVFVSMGLHYKNMIEFFV